MREGTRVLPRPAEGLRAGAGGCSEGGPGPLTASPAVRSEGVGLRTTSRGENNRCSELTPRERRSTAEPSPSERGVDVAPTLCGATSLPVTPAGSWPLRPGHTALAFPGQGHSGRMRGCRDKSLYIIVAANPQILAAHRARAIPHSHPRPRQGEQPPCGRTAQSRCPTRTSRQKMSGQPSEGLRGRPLRKECVPLCGRRTYQM